MSRTELNPLGGELANPIRIKPVSAAGAWPVLNKVVFDVNVPVSTTQSYPLPFPVSDPRMLDIDWQSSTAASGGGFLPESLLIPDGSGTGYIRGIPNTADRTRDFYIYYDKVANSIKVQTGQTYTVLGMLQVRLRDRKVKNESALASPADTTEVLLPFSITDLTKVYVGQSSTGFSFIAKFLKEYLSPSDTHAWHFVGTNASAGNAQMKITSKDTYMRGSVATSNLYIIEFE